MRRHRKKKIIDPKTFKKHSDVIKERSSKMLVAGEKISTKTGYVIEGTKCRNYETYYQYLAEGMITDRVLHKKKSRSIRVLSGRGTVNIIEDGKVRPIDLYPGDEVHLEPGVEYEVTSMPKINLELLVTQAYKYTASLEVTKNNSSKAMLSSGELRAVSHDEVALQYESTQLPPRRRRSKAAQQQQEIAATRGQDVTPEAGSVEQALHRDKPNLKPSNDFDWESAG